MIRLPVLFPVILDQEGLELDSPAARNTFDLLQRKSTDVRNIQAVKSVDWDITYHRRHARATTRTQQY